MGVDGGRLEMLFLVPDKRGNGLGRLLVEYGMKHCGVKSVTVNEQNPEAKGFYEHMGFSVARSGDFPIGNGYYMNDYIMGLEIV